MDSTFYLGICHKCGCTFMYDDEEIKKNIYQNYTDCPVCGKEVKADKKPFTFNGQKATEYKVVMKGTE
jgi:hypothetical protein